MKRKIYHLLLQSFDRSLSINEQRILSTALEESDVLRKEERLQKRIRDAAKMGPGAHFSPFFAERVINRIQRGNETVHDLFWDMLIAQFKPMAIAATAIMIMLISYNMFQQKAFNVKNLLPTAKITYEEAMDPTLAYFGE